MLEGLGGYMEGIQQPKGNPRVVRTHKVETAHINTHLKALALVKALL